MTRLDTKLVHLYLYYSNTSIQIRNNKVMFLMADSVYQQNCTHMQTHAHTLIFDWRIWSRSLMSFPLFLILLPLASGRAAAE